MSDTWDEPCWCGHPASEHNYTPSGCGTTHCLHDSEYGEIRCEAYCREFYPAQEYTDTERKEQQ